MNSTKTRRGAVLSLLSILASTSIHAAGSSPGLEPVQLIDISEEATAQTTAVFGDQVDLYTGSLAFEQTDIAVPVNGEVPIVVSRSFKTGSAYDTNTNLGFADWDASIPNIHMLLPYRLMNFDTNEYESGYRDNLCSGLEFYPAAASEGFSGGGFEGWEFWHGYNLSVPGSGSQRIVIKDAGNSGFPDSARLVTKGNWQLECRKNAASGEVLNDKDSSTADDDHIIVATSPQGAKYYFTIIERRSIGYHRKSYDPKIFFELGLYRIYATRMVDRFGNVTLYDYGDDFFLDSITSGSTQVTFSWNTTDRTISRITHGGRVWQYVYADDTHGRRRLVRVELPETGYEWRFDLQALGEAGVSYPNNNGPIYSAPLFTGSITSPYGSTATFTVAQRFHGRYSVPMQWRLPFGCTDPQCGYYWNEKHFNVVSLLSKRITGPGIDYQWSYEYSQSMGSWEEDTVGQTCTPGNTESWKWLDITRPDGSRERHWFDMSWEWCEGAEVKTAYYNAGETTPVRTVINEYERSPIVGNFGQPRTNTARDAFRQELASRTILESGSQYVTTYDHDNLGQVIAVTGSNDFSSKTRKTCYVHHDTGDRWILGLVKTVRVGASGSCGTSFGTLVDNVAYGPDGEVTSYTHLDADPVYAGYYGNGRMATFTDANENSTGFGNYVAGVPQQFTFADTGVVEQVVNTHGEIVSRTDQLNFTHEYSYDDLGRLTGISYPASTTNTWLPKSIAWNGSSTTHLSQPHWSATYRNGSDSYKVIQYDGLIRPAVIETLTGTGEKRYVSYEYNASGRVVFQSYPSSAPGASAGVDTVYDALGRRKRAVFDTENGSARERDDDNIPCLRRTRHIHADEDCIAREQDSRYRVEHSRPDDFGPPVRRPRGHGRKCQCDAALLLRRRGTALQARRTRIGCDRLLVRRCRKRRRRCQWAGRGPCRLRLRKL